MLEGYVGRKEAFSHPVQSVRYHRRTLKTKQKFAQGSNSLPRGWEMLPLEAMRMVVAEPGFARLPCARTSRGLEEEGGGTTASLNSSQADITH